MKHKKFPIFFIYFSLLCSLFSSPISLASFSASEKQEENKYVRTQSSRGCPKQLGDILIRQTSPDTIEFKNLKPKVSLKIKQSPTEKNQDILVALIDNKNDEQVFSSYQKFTGSGTLEIQLPQLKNNYQYVFVAQIVCNKNRPSSHKSLRILLKTNADF